VSEKVNHPNNCRENKSEESEEMNKYILLKSLKRIKFPAGTF